MTDNDLGNQFGFDYTEELGATELALEKELNEKYYDVSCYYDKEKGYYIYSYAAPSSFDQSAVIEIPDSVYRDVYIKIKYNEYNAKRKKYYELNDEYINTNDSNRRSNIIAEMNALNYNEDIPKPDEHFGYEFDRIYEDEQENIKKLVMNNPEALDGAIRDYVLLESKKIFGKKYSDDESIRDFELKYNENGTVEVIPLRRYTLSAPEIASEFGIYYPSEFLKNPYPHQSSTYDDSTGKYKTVYRCTFSLYELKQLYRDSTGSEPNENWGLGQYEVWLRDGYPNCNNGNHWGTKFDEITVNTQGGITVIINDEHSNIDKLNNDIWSEEHSRNMHFIDYYLNNTATGRDEYLKFKVAGYYTTDTTASSKEVFTKYVYEKIGISSGLSYEVWLKQTPLSEIIQMANDNNLSGVEDEQYYEEDGVIKLSAKNKNNCITKINEDKLGKILYEKYGNKNISYEEWISSKNTEDLVSMANENRLFENMDCKVYISADGSLVMNVQFEDVSKLTEEEFKFLIDNEEENGNYADYQRYINREISKKVDSIYDINGVEVYCQTITAENGNMTKIYYSQYNGHTIAIPHMLPGNDFEGVSSTIESIVNRDEQLSSTLGYSMSVRIDSPTFSTRYNGYANIVEENGTFYVILENGQRVKIDSSEKYKITDVENMVETSKQYQNYQIDTALSSTEGYENSQFDVRTYGDNYHVYINGKEVIIPKSAGVFNEDGTFANKNLFNQYCKDAGVSENEIKKGINLYNPNIAAELQYTCINFPDETFYKDLIEKLNGIQEELSAPIYKITTAKERMNSFALRRTKELTKAMADNIKTVQDSIPLLQERIEISYKLLRATDDDLKSCLDDMINEIFNLSYLDSGELRMNWYETTEDDDKTINVETEISLDEYFIKKGEQCAELAQNIKNNINYGVEITVDDCQKYGIKNYKKTDDGRIYVDLETFNRAIENYCRTEEDIKINNDYTIYQYLAEKNPELSEKLEEYSLYMSGDQAAVAACTVVELNERFNEMAPYFKYVLTEEYNNVLNKLRTSDDYNTEAQSIASQYNFALDGLDVNFMSLTDIALMSSINTSFSNKWSTRVENMLKEDMFVLDHAANSLWEFTTETDYFFLPEGEKLLSYKNYVNGQTYRIWDYAEISLLEQDQYDEWRAYSEAYDNTIRPIVKIIDKATNERKGQMEAAKILSENLSDGEWNWYDTLEVNGSYFLEGLEYYPSTFMQLLAPESADSVTVYRNKYILQYLSEAKNINRQSDIDNMYKNGKITKKEKELYEIIASNRDEIIEKYNTIANTSAFFKGAGIMSFELILKALHVPDTAINIIKAGSAGGKVAHQLVGAGYNDAIAYFAGIITALGTYKLATTLEKITIGKDSEGKWGVRTINKRTDDAGNLINNPNSNGYFLFKGNEVKAKTTQSMGIFEFLQKRKEELTSISTYKTAGTLTSSYSTMISLFDYAKSYYSPGNIAASLSNIPVSMVIAKADTWVLNNMMAEIINAIPMSNYEQLGIPKEYTYDITKLLYPTVNYDYAGRNTMKFLFQWFKF